MDGAQGSRLSLHANACMPAFRPYSCPAGLHHSLVMYTVCPIKVWTALQIQWEDCLPAVVDMLVCVWGGGT